MNLISVERNPTSDGNRFTVKFTKNAEDVICHYAEGMDQQKGETKSKGYLLRSRGNLACSLVERKIYIYIYI